ncbi:class E sortase [Promicromonospora panici]|uniref:class E sortase n=1 Tax=Promicromonospora panici TaxID=2219658 RepID=UPI00101C6FC9|nr:class E sortase [Promicromonospora panici]
MTHAQAGHNVPLAQEVFPIAYQRGPSGMGPRNARRPRGASSPMRPVAWLIGVMGELLVTAGLVLGLFVVWQLWWTDVEGARAQNEIIAEMDWGSAPTGPATATENHGPPPVMKEPPEDGTLFAQMYIPRFGDDYVKPVAEGTDKATVLDTIGIGHYNGTAMPGDLGNFAVAAHRTTYGKPFNQIAELKNGDALVVRTEKTWYVYKVTESKIVYPQNVEVIAPVPGVTSDQPMPELTDRFITLTSCHPMFSATQRYIVHGELEYWSPVGDGKPKELVG